MCGVHWKSYVMYSKGKSNNDKKNKTEEKHNWISSNER